MNATDCQPWTAIYSYTRCLLKKLEYCMPVTSFSKETWQSITWPALQATLHKAQMAERYPREVLYASQLYSGYVLEDPYTKQGIIKLITYIQESVNLTHTGQLIQASAEGF